MVFIGAGALSMHLADRFRIPAIKFIVNKCIAIMNESLGPDGAVVVLPLPGGDVKEADAFLDCGGWGG
jgi:hypothetical protein